MHGLQCWPPPPSAAHRSPSALSARLVCARTPPPRITPAASSAAAITVRSSSTLLAMDMIATAIRLRLLPLLRRSDRSAAAAGRIPIALVALAVHLLSHAAIALHLPR